MHMWSFYLEGKWGPVSYWLPGYRATCGPLPVAVIRYLLFQECDPQQLLGTKGCDMKISGMFQSSRLIKAKVKKPVCTTYFKKLVPSALNFTVGKSFPTVKG
ncbi:hypothetical protein NPIL_140631 [Nephila pilipes]|uniref:Uncharacterized protein n=1 Tax=Nephila pilipes TaxID=299642 RepID=A0A8X6MZM7_NEPPI|nr:hypothetical protein NPIL_140631 [Nephila pilipes]